MQQITWEDFSKVGLVAGTITKVEDFPEARKPAYKIWADFGEHGIKKTSAQVTDLYTKEDLLGKQISGVVNFPTKQIGPFASEFLLTGFFKETGEVVLAVPDTEVPNGSKIG